MVCKAHQFFQYLTRTCFHRAGSEHWKVPKRFRHGLVTWVRTRRSLFPQNTKSSLVNSNHERQERSWQRVGLIIPRSWVQSSVVALLHKMSRYKQAKNKDLSSNYADGNWTRILRVDHLTGSATFGALWMNHLKISIFTIVCSSLLWPNG